MICKFQRVSEFLELMATRRSQKNRQNSAVATSTEDRTRGKDYFCSNFLKKDLKAGTSFPLVKPIKNQEHKEVKNRSRKTSKVTTNSRSRPFDIDKFLKEKCEFFQEIDKYKLHEENENPTAPHVFEAYSTQVRSIIDLNASIASLEDVFAVSVSDTSAIDSLPPLEHIVDLVPETKSAALPLTSTPPRHPIPKSSLVFTKREA